MAKTAKRYAQAEKKVTMVSLPRYMVGIYSRLSVDNNDRKSESIENQITMIEDFIRQNNENPKRTMNLYIYDTYVDRGKTGTNFERNGFERLMSDVRSRNVNCIIVKDFSRFGRNYVETGNYIEKILPFLGVRFISVNDKYDSMGDNGSDGKFSMNIKNLVNDMYAKDISQKNLGVRKELQSKGSYVCGAAPYGYKLVKKEGKNTFEIDEDAAEVVRFIFEQYAEGQNIKNIIRALYQKKIHRISDYQKKYHHVFALDGETLLQWGDSTIRAVLKRQTYCGDMVQHRMESTFYLGEKGFQDVDPKEWIVAHNSHEAIIGKEMFYKAIQRIEHETKAKSKIVKRKNEKKYIGYENVFRNVVYCGECGRHLQYDYYQSEKDGHRNYQYYCQAFQYEDERKCLPVKISEEKLIEIFRNTLQKWLASQNYKGKDLVAVNERFTDETKKNFNKERTEISHELSKLSRNKIEAFSCYKTGEMSVKEYQFVRDNAIEKENFLNKRLSEIDQNERLFLRNSDNENRFLRSLLKVKSSRKLNEELVESVVDRIKVYADGNIEIILKLKGGGQNGR